MGRIVAGFGIPHVLFPPNAVEDQADRVFSGLMDVRRRLRELKPDVLVLAGSDHLNSFNLGVQVTLGVGVADDFVTLEERGLPSFAFAGHRDFAESFARFAARDDFDLVQIEEVAPDHGVAVPKLILDPDGEIPTVLIYLNTVMPIPPSPGRCHRLGETLRAMVSAERLPQERVVVVGLGGMSHWICVPEQGQVAEDFDRNFIAKMIAGQAGELAKLQTEELLALAGNGGLELGAWLFMGGALSPDVVGECIFYEPMPSWMTGMGAIALTPASG